MIGKPFHPASLWEAKVCGEMMQGREFYVHQEQHTRDAVLSTWPSHGPRESSVMSECGDQGRLKGVAVSRRAQFCWSHNQKALGHTMMWQRPLGTTWVQSTGSTLAPSKEASLSFLTTSVHAPSSYPETNSSTDSNWQAWDEQEAPLPQLNSSIKVSGLLS